MIQKILDTISNRIAKEQVAYIGDMVRNVETGKVAILENIVDSPYYGQNGLYAYVIGYDSTHHSSYSDYWHPSVIEVI